MQELRKMATEVSDADLANVATVSAGNSEEIGGLVSGALERVGRQGRNLNISWILTGS